LKKSKIKKTLSKYKNIQDSFKYAYVGIPKSIANLEENFFGTFESFLKKYPNFTDFKKLPIVLYMHGSSGLYTGDVYRKIITKDAKFIFFAPNSFKIKNRPTYKTALDKPAKEKNYLKVHRLRVAEIYYNLKELKKLPFVDSNNIFLMGNSEGGLASAIYPHEKFKGRIITAFSCESSYFYTNFKLGAKKSEPFLNIIGTHDQFFSKLSLLNSNYNIDGNGIESLKKYKFAKIVILTKTKHDITTNPYVKDEILSFLKLWRSEE